MAMRIGVLGLGSVFWGPYASLIQRLAQEGRAELVAAYDVDAEKRKATATRFGIETDLSGPEELLDRDDVDTVLVLTSMNQHGDLALAGLERGKHVLVEKPMATSLEQAATLVSAAATAASSPAPGLRAARRAVADVPGDAPARERRRGRAALPRPAPATAGPDRGGASGSTSPEAARCSISASTTSPRCAASSAR